MGQRELALTEEHRSGVAAVAQIRPRLAASCRTMRVRRTGGGTPPTAAMTLWQGGTSMRRELQRRTSPASGQLHCPVALTQDLSNRIFHVVRPNDAPIDTVECCTGLPNRQGFSSPQFRACLAHLAVPATCA